jgi:hypothetical protein
MLANCAQWIAEEAKYYGIPIVRLNAAEAQGGGRGVCQHVDLGSAGGGHHDCGAGFPMIRVLDMARGGSIGPDPSPTPPAPKPKQEEDQLIASALGGGGSLQVFELKDDAIYYTWQKTSDSSWNGSKPNAQVAGMNKFCDATDVVSIAAETSTKGLIHVFGRKKNGSVVYTHQKANTNTWMGGEEGKTVAALQPFSPAP